MNTSLNAFLEELKICLEGWEEEGFEFTDFRIGDFFSKNWALVEANSITVLEASFKLIENFSDEEFDSPSFWHIMEALNETEYIKTLFESVDRKSTHFTNLLLNRMINGGIETEKCFEKLRGVVSNPANSEFVRKDAQRFLDYQSEKVKSLSIFTQIIDYQYIRKEK